MLYYLLAPWLNAFGTVRSSPRAVAVVAARRRPRADDHDPPRGRRWADARRVWALGMTVPGARLGAGAPLTGSATRSSGDCWSPPSRTPSSCCSAWSAPGGRSAGRSAGEQAWAKTERLVEEPCDSPVKVALAAVSPHVHPPEVFLIAGTRPEAIKLAPVAAAMRAAGRLTPVLVASGQHPTMVTQALDAFDVRADVTLPLQRVTGSQPELLTEMIRAAGRAVGGAQAGRGHRPGRHHHDAGRRAWPRSGGASRSCTSRPGLRSGDLDSPFPEEANRRLVAPGRRAAPGADRRWPRRTCWTRASTPADVLITGNTVVDATLAVAAARAAVRGRPGRPGPWMPRARPAVWCW